MGTIKTTNIEPIANNGTVTLGSSGDTFTVPSGVTVNMSSATQTGVGGANTPAFDARASSNQTGLTSGGWTKVQFDTELFDVGGGYDATNDKFVVPSGEAGKYFFTTFAKINSAGGSATLLGTGMRFNKNGSNVKESIHFIANGSNSAEGKGVNCVLDLAVSDYIEVYAYYQDNGGGTGSITGSSDFDTFFTGFKLIGA